jgi:glycosyltransferase involved in cell wall biosynthesis
MRKPRVLLVTNVLTHYRLPLYEELQKRLQVEFVFYSDGQEWYWQQTEQPDGDKLHSARWLKGRWIGQTRITPGLVSAVLSSRADVIIKDPNGKFALPVTYLLARMQRKPFVLWASLWEHPSKGIHRFTRRLMRYLYRHSDAVVTYGRHVSRYVISEGTESDRVFEAPQAVRSQAPHSVIRRWNAPLELLFVGRLETWKGPQVLLYALGQLRAEPSWRLRIAGRGSEARSLQDLANQLGIAERVEFLGHIPNQTLWNLYASSDVVIVPSIRTARFTEPWSLTVNEAMHSGCLVVASDCVGAVQDGLVQEGRTGMVFASGDADSLANKLASILDASDPQPQSVIARAGQDEVSQYSFPAAAEAFVTAVTRVVSPG